MRLAGAWPSYAAGKKCVRTCCRTGVKGDLGGMVKLECRELSLSALSSSASLPCRMSTDAVWPDSTRDHQDSAATTASVKSRRTTSAAAGSEASDRSIWSLAASVRTSYALRSIPTGANPSDSIVVKMRFATGRAAILEATKAPGFALAIVEGKKIIYAKGFGYKDYENKIRDTIRAEGLW